MACHGYCSSVRPDGPVRVGWEQVHPVGVGQVPLASCQVYLLPYCQGTLLVRGSTTMMGGRGVIDGENVAVG